ncbi:MAG: hypothetical protein WBW48_23385, partial [Anaerolineae bacterium]
QGEYYACIERHAVTNLNPDVCRLAGMWVDDMCLQAVYEAADDPTICDRLYLSGVVPNCHAYYAARSPTPTATPAVTAPPPTPTPVPPTYTPPIPPTYTPAPPTGVPTLVPAGTSTPVTPAAAYATQEAARQATVVARATASPFPTAGQATVRTGQPSIAITQRDGLFFQVRLPKDTYLAGEGGQAEAILRNEGPETVFVRGDGENLFLPVLLDEQGHEPIPWPWSLMRLPGIPLLPSRLDPGQVITETLNFQVPLEEQAAGHAHVLWAETHFSRPAPDRPDGWDNLWMHLETGPIPLQVMPPDPSQQLVAELEADRDGWRLRVTDTAGRVPPGPLWGFHEVVSFGTASTGPLQDSADGTWSGAWGERVSQSDSQISMRAWVAAPGYVTAAITQTMPGAGDVRRWFGAWEPPTRQTFDSLETAQATLDFPLYRPGWLPTGTVLDGVQVETRTSGECRWTNVSQMYRLPDDTWLELIQMVTTDHYASAGWGQARYEPEARPVTVGENTGYAIQRFDWWVLDWRVGGVGFELRAPVPALSLDDLLSIATGAQHPGLSLIYHLDGTLYRGGFFGAEAVRLGPLTPDALYNARISGHFLAYTIKGRAMLIDLEDGDIRTIDPVERPDFRISNLVWSDGGVLAYAGTYDFPKVPLGQVAEVTVVELEGDEGRVVTLVITEWIGATVLGYDRASGRVWLIPRGQDPAISKVHAYDIERLAVSPHIVAVSGYGEAVASSDLSHLAIADYDYEAEQALTRVYSLLEPTAPPVVLRHSKGTLGAHYLWSQGRLAYVVLSGFLRWGDSPSEADGIWIWEPEAGEPRQVAEATNEDDAPIAWTPDGAWLLVRQTPPGGTPRYAAVPLAGGESVPMSVPSKAQVLGWAHPTPTPLPTTAISLPGRLIYESAGDVWIVEQGQPPRVLLTDGSNPHLSPDGNRLVFRRANPELPLSDLWLADFTCPASPAPCQVNQRRLIGPAEFGSPLIYDLAWSPDGRTVALTTGADAKTIYSEDLWLVNVETGDYRQVLDDGGGVPHYSPDGAWIALNMPYTGYQHGQLSLIAADGSSYRPLFDYLIFYEGKWLPDGVLVAGIVRLARTTEAEVPAELWQVPVVGEPVRLATIPIAHSFCWSADGRRLAYLADDPVGWLHIAQGDGSEPVAVPGTDERTWAHSWSPGGQFLAVIHDGQYSFVSGGPDPALIPMPVPFWLWLDDESYLTAEWITDDPQADRGHFEISRTWLDGQREFLFTAESLNGLSYRP